MLTKRHFTRLAITALSLVSSCAFGADGDVHVLNHAALNAEFDAPTQQGSQKRAPGARSMRFNAFGKNYTATLETNGAIEVPADSQAQAYKGAIDGRSGSWLRLTKIGGELHGLVFDGTDLFAIEPAAAIGADASQDTVIFRLADTRTELGAEFCAALAPSEGQNALDLYKSLSNEAKSIMGQMQKTGARMRLQLSALMDPPFRNRYASEAAAIDAIVARVNNADGIFSAQLGIEVELKSATLPEILTDLVVDDINAETLLQSVAHVRSESPALYSTGITHLFTGQDLATKTVGIAYMDSVCGRKYGASLSEARDRGAWFDALVVAHELGHTFGSPHDGEGECAATPQSFLMALTINGNDQFSQCSVSKIRPRIQTASCLIPIPVSDVSLPATQSEQRAALNTEFVWSMPVANIGNADAGEVRVRLPIPTAVTVIKAQVTGGSCGLAGGEISCDLGTLAAQVTRTVELTLKGTQMGAQWINASVTSRGDGNTANNSLTALIRIEPTADVALSLAAPSSAVIGSSFEATFTVANKSTANIGNITVEFSLPSGLTVKAAPLFDGIQCQTQFQLLRCSTPSLTAGSAVSGTVSLIAYEGGTQTLGATVTGDFYDQQPTDNSAQRPIAVSAGVATASATSGSADSGGGSLGFLLLAMMAALGVIRSVDNPRLR